MQNEILETKAYILQLFDYKTFPSVLIVASRDNYIVHALTFLNASTRHYTTNTVRTANCMTKKGFHYSNFVYLIKLLQARSFDPKVKSKCKSNDAEYMYNT